MRKAGALRAGAGRLDVEGARGLRRKAWGGLCGTGLGLTAAASRPAYAAGFDLIDGDLAPIMLATLILILALGALALTNMRRRHTLREREIGAELERTRADLERARQFLASEPQIVIVWDRADSEPRVEGEFSLVSEAMNAKRILSFPGWLDSAGAERVQEWVN